MQISFYNAGWRHDQVQNQLRNDSDYYHRDSDSDIDNDRDGDR